MTQVPSERLSLRELARCHGVIRAQFGGYDSTHPMGQTGSGLVFDPLGSMRPASIPDAA